MIGYLKFVYEGQTYSDIPLNMEVSEHCTFHTNAMVAKVALRQVIIFNDKDDGKGLAALVKEHPEVTFIVAGNSVLPGV